MICLAGIFKERFRCKIGFMASSYMYLIYMKWIILCHRSICLKLCFDETVKCFDLYDCYIGVCYFASILQGKNLSI